MKVRRVPRDVNVVFKFETENCIYLRYLCGKSLLLLVESIGGDVLVLFAGANYETGLECCVMFSCAQTVAAAFQ